MRSLIWAGLRRHPSRYLAVVLAVMLGVGFAVASSVFTTTMGNRFAQSVAAPLSKVDLVVDADPDTGIGPVSADIPTLAALSGISAVHPNLQTWMETPGRGGIVVESLPPDTQQWMTLAAGRLPGDGELLVDSRTAERRHWQLGGTVTLLGYSDTGSPEIAFTVVGLADTTEYPMTGSFDRAWSSAATVTRLSPGIEPLALHLSLTNGTDPEIAAQAVAQALDGPRVRTAEQATADEIARYTDDSGVLGLLLSAFVVLAAVVAIIVVAGTFTILQAQRRRQDALVRCVGATTAQLSRVTLLEAAVLGAIGSALGVAVGIGAAAAVTALAGMGSAFTVPLLWPAIIAVLGVLATVLAATGSARRATRVPPLAALRPVDDQVTRQRVRRGRAVIASLALVLGIAALAKGMLDGGAAGLMLSVFGGVAVTAGVVTGLPAVIVPLTRPLAPLLGRGVPGRLAADNVRRHPARAAAACAALAIGIGAVSTLLVAANSGQQSIAKATGDRYQLDIVLTGPGLETFPGRLHRSDDIAAAMVVPAGTIRIEPAPSEADRLVPDQDPVAYDITAYGPTAENLDAVGNGIGVAAGEIALPWTALAVLDVDTGDQVQVTGNRGTLLATVAERPVTPDGSAVLLSSDLLQVAAADEPAAVWIKLSENARPDAVIGDLADLIGDEPVEISGSATFRGDMASTLSLIVTIALGLLAVTAVIAVVGVGNTLGLSVLERTGETGLLRALGLTRGGVRRMVIGESVLLAVVACVLGIAAGIGLGFAAVASIFGVDSSDIVLSVPWLDLAGVCLAAVAAAVLAGFLPARRAARTSPLAALSRD